MKKIILLVVTLSLFFSASVVLAQNGIEVPAKSGSDINFNPAAKNTTRIGGYTLLTELPGFNKSIDDNVANGGAGEYTLAEYIKVIVRIAIGVIGVLAVVMIVVAGVQYMGSGMVTEKEAAKQRLTGAVFGLILAVSSVLLLRTINPQLTNLSIGDGTFSDCTATTKKNDKGQEIDKDGKIITDPKTQNTVTIYVNKDGKEDVKCNTISSEQIGIPAELVLHYEEEDLSLENATVSPSGVSSACPGGMLTINTVNQNGLLACKDIAENFKNMVAAAKKDGIILTAYGGRTMESQIALRKKNCGGSSQYNVYEKPSGQCKPPTARPGKSMHQLGLAFDIGENGKTICYPNKSSVCKSKGNKAFLWLEKNASTYKLFNLPSEAWHWSVNGK